MKQLLFTKGPQGPIGATLGTAMNNFCSSSNKVSTHYITWLFSFWIWRRRCLKFAWFWPFGALPLGPHGGHTYYLNNFESPTPKDDSCQVWLKSNHAFSRRRWKCKKFTDDGRRTTHDGRRTTDDGRKRTAIAHSSLRLRWAKNQSRNCRTIKKYDTNKCRRSPTITTSEWKSGQKGQRKMIALWLASESLPTMHALYTVLSVRSYTVCLHLFCTVHGNAMQIKTVW